MQKLKQAIAKRMRIARFVLELSQMDLAKKAKVSQSTIAQIESGRKLPSLTTLFKIAKVLKCDVSELVRNYNE